MDAMDIVLALVTLGAVSAVIWLLIERTRLKQTSAVGESQRLDADRRADDALAHLAERDSQLSELSDRLSAHLVEAAELRTRIEEAQTRYEQQLKQEQDHFTELLEAERDRLVELNERFQKAFDASATDALRKSSEQFLKLAEQTFETARQKTNTALNEHVKPIAETLKKTDLKLAELEKQRHTAYDTLAEQLRQAAQNNELLRKETGNLVSALRKPQVRGRYGEIQLQRVAELAGMESYCDFNTQVSSRDDSGRLLRPDMVVTLPNGRAIAIDAKTNIEAYLDAIESDSPDQAEHHLDRFARHVADQAIALSKKDYWLHVSGSFDFVVMFIPGDQFIDAALERKPELLDLATQHGVILASPSTLVGLLRAVYVGWREKGLSDSAKELFELGRELHERASIALGHAADVGRALETAQRKYNDFVGSVDGRLMPTLRKFEEKGAKSAKELESPREIEGTTREIKSLEARSESLPESGRPSLTT